MVAVPVAGLEWPVRVGSGGDGGSALLVAGAAPVTTAGEPMAWCKIVAVAPARLRRDGRVQAAGRPCDHARLGVVEQELDRRCGPGTIEKLTAEGRLPGGSKLQAQGRRERSAAVTKGAPPLLNLLPAPDD